MSPELLVVPRAKEAHQKAKECAYTIQWYLPIKRNKCCNTDEPQKHAMWKKKNPDTKDNILCGFIYLKCPEKEIYRNRK